MRLHSNRRSTIFVSLQTVCPAVNWPTNRFQNATDYASETQGIPTLIGARISLRDAQLLDPVAGTGALALIRLRLTPPPPLLDWKKCNLDFGPIGIALKNA